jgi:hypothetical protein
MAKVRRLVSGAFGPPIARGDRDETAAQLERSLAALRTVAVETPPSVLAVKAVPVLAVQAAVDELYAIVAAELYHPSRQHVQAARDLADQPDTPTAYQFAATIVLTQDPRWGVDVAVVEPGWIAAAFNHLLPLALGNVAVFGDIIDSYARGVISHGW